MDPGEIVPKVEENFIKLEEQPLLVGGLEHQFYFPIYWVANHPN